MKPHWIIPYIGIPYVIGGRDRAGLDCWGLIYLVYKEQFNIELPLYLVTEQIEVREMCRLVLAETARKWLELAEPVDGCMTALSQRDAIHHVGLWTTADGGKHLHCSAATFKVVAERPMTLRRRGFKTIKFYGLHN